MQRQRKALLALLLSLMLTVIPALEGFAEGTEEPHIEKTAETTAEPTEEATAEPTEEATAEPMEEATAEPTEEATAEPTEEATVEPTEEATAEPIEEATAEPIEEATAEPMEEATAEPTEEATVEPTEEATEEPTPEPSIEPMAALAILSAEHPAFDLDKDDDTMTAIVIGYDDTNEKAVEIPETSDGYTIVKIAGSAFAGTAITSVTIPGSVTSIGESAFANCGFLTSAALGNGVKSIGASAFKNCAMLSSVTFGNAVETIGANAFMNCTSLVTTTLKSGVQTIGDSAFSDCTALNEIALPYETLTYVGVNTFTDCPLVKNKFVYSIKNDEVTVERYTDDATNVAIADKIGGKRVSTIAASAFLGRTAVVELTIGTNVKKLGTRAFSGLVKLAKVNMNNAVVEIGESAFDGCAALGGVTLPDSLIKIGTRAFADTDITSVEIPSNVTALSTSAFDGCAITSFEVAATNATYATIDNLLFEISDRTLMRAYGSETEITVPTSAGIIGARAFAGKTSLKRVTLATTVTKIEAAAFSGCTVLEKVTIPNSVTAIADDAFHNCTALTVLVFSYDAYAYDYCRSNSIAVDVVSTDVPPSKITLSNMVIGVKNTTTIVPTFTPANATCDLTYASSNTKIVAVDQEGRIKGKKIGKARIYVMTDNGLMTSCIVRVKAAPRKVTIAVGSTTLGVGQTFDLDAELPNGTGGTITYTTNNDAVATVNGNGIVTAVGIGTCKIRAITYNGKVAKCKVTVNAAPTKLTVSDEALSLGIGQKQYITWSLDNGQNASAMTFTSDNPTVATVSGSGRVKARRQGFATITVSAYNGLSATVNVSVLKAPTSLKVGSTSIKLYAKQMYEVPVELTTGSTAGFTVSTSRKSVAKVYLTEDGIYIRGKRTGTATITITTHNGLKKQIRVRVRKAPSKMTLNVTSGTLGAGDTFRLKPSFNAGAGAVMTYTSSNSTIASVDDDGDVVGLKAGDVTITATTHNGLSKTCELTICAAPATLSVAAEDLELGKGEKYWISPVVKDAAGNDYLGRVFYKTSVTGIATVNWRGKIKARNPGDVTITIYTYNGLTDSLELHVKAAPRGVSLNKRTITLGVDMNYQLTYSFRGSNAGGTVAFTSSNPNVCSVDETGYLTGKNAGTATITVRTYNGYKATCYVIVQ